MSSKTIKFEIVTPERVVLKQEILQITVPTANGEITVLPNHIPLVSIIKSGVIEIKLADNITEIISVGSGFIEVMKDKVVILADTAERAEELDEARIKEARANAEKLKSEAKNLDDVQFANIASKIEKELARERAVHKWRRLNNINPGK
ncbi:MAG TPA: ATP synthase F1 subunit epsilon [Candidatus Saccharimonadales bacterium]|nr:ATP synthase F1 subunit epsilon [Candidatus Saccharimonadales bacterium]